MQLIFQKTTHSECRVSRAEIQQVFTRFESERKCSKFLSKEDTLRERRFVIFSWKQESSYISGQRACCLCQFKWFLLKIVARKEQVGFVIRNLSSVTNTCQWLVQKGLADIPKSADEGACLDRPIANLGIEFFIQFFLSLAYVTGLSGWS